MPVRDHVDTRPETVGDFEECALESYLAGAELVASGRGGYVRAGVYLMGGAAEMLLKSAYFRLLGRGVGDPVTRQDLLDAAAHAKTLGIVETPEGFHSILFWTQCLVEERRAVARPMPAALEADLMAAADRLYRNWHISLRYRAVGMTILDEAAVTEDVAWLVKYHGELC